MASSRDAGRFEIVAHRGMPDELPENTLASFERAAELGADAVELDVRFTRDGQPVVYHYVYLDETTTGDGPLFERTWAELKQLDVVMKGGGPSGHKIPLLTDVLDALGGQIGLEIELKGPEPEAVTVMCEILDGYRDLWDSIEVTSFEAALLQGMHYMCPELAVDLLFPRTEPWMKPDVVAYHAAQLARLAQARAVHLHPVQLSRQVVETIRGYGIDVHTWDVNSPAEIEAVLETGVTRLCTDHLRMALAARGSR